METWKVTDWWKTWNCNFLYSTAIVILSSSFLVSLGIGLILRCCDQELSVTDQNNKQPTIKVQLDYENESEVVVKVAAESTMSWKKAGTPILKGQSLKRARGGGWGVDSEYVIAAWVGFLVVAGEMVVVPNFHIG